MLELEIVPGKSLGSFLLGMTVTEAISIIQEAVKLISHAEVSYNEKELLTGDITINLTNDGILLKFDMRSQRLKLIEIYNVTKVKLTYFASVFCAPDTPPTFALVYSRFGPSYPGDFDTPNQLYYLHYPGLSFIFPIPDQFAAAYEKSTADLPLEFPDGRTPVTNHIFIYNGANLQSISRGNYLDFDSSTQDTISVLGPPQKVFYKQEDKMRIHSLHGENRNAGDYFYNYFSLGIDVLFSVSNHTAKKFILHSNFPSHYDFNHYCKCFYRIVFAPGQLNGNNDPIEVNPHMKWDEIQKLIGKSGKPLVYNRGSSANPFGATLFYGYPNIIFEVMRNDHVASVILFKI